MKTQSKIQISDNETGRQTQTADSVYSATVANGILELLKPN